MIRNTEKRSLAEDGILARGDGHVVWRNISPWAEESSAHLSTVYSLVSRSWRRASSSRRLMLSQLLLVANRGRSGTNRPRDVPM